MVPTITLKGSGQKMPLVGFGLWKVSKDTCADAVYQAIKAGYRLFQMTCSYLFKDGACDYGNEFEAGQGVQRALKDGLVTREELFITSKLWNTFHAEEHVKAAAKKQLGLWGLNYFDLFLIHFPISLEYVDPSHRYPPEWYGDDGKIHLQNTPVQVTWTCMEELVDEGLTKNIGISNFSGALIIDLLRYARIPPALLQVELHPYLNQETLVTLCQVFGIALNAYSSFGPQGYLELGMDKGMMSLMEHDCVTSIAKEHNKSPAQVLLRWSTQRGIVVIPKSGDLYDRLVENLQCCSFDLTKDEMKQIGSLNTNARFNNPAEIDPRLAIFA